MGSVSAMRGFRAPWISLSVVETNQHSYASHEKSISSLLRKINSFFFFLSFSAQKKCLTKEQREGCTENWNNFLLYRGILLLHKHSRNIAKQ